MMQKLSTRMPVLEIRVKVLKEIAAENSIVLQLEETTSVSTEVCNSKTKTGITRGIELNCHLP